MRNCVQKRLKRLKYLQPKLALALPKPARYGIHGTDYKTTETNTPSGQLPVKAKPFHFPSGDNADLFHSMVHSTIWENTKVHQNLKCGMFLNHVHLGCVQVSWTFSKCTDRQTWLTISIRRCNSQSQKLMHAKWWTVVYSELNYSLKQFKGI